MLAARLKELASHGCSRAASSGPAGARRLRAHRRRARLSQGREAIRQWGQALLAAREQTATRSAAPRRGAASAPSRRASARDAVRTPPCPRARTGPRAPAPPDVRVRQPPYEEARDQRIDEAAEQDADAQQNADTRQEAARGVALDRHGATEDGGRHRQDTERDEMRVTRSHEACCARSRSAEPRSFLRRSS